MPNLLVMLIISAIGLGYFLYGQRRQEFVFIVIGVVLIIYPYIIRPSYVRPIHIFIIIGLLLMAIPFVARLMRR